jgi:hypothetical protein
MAWAHIERAVYCELSLTPSRMKRGCVPVLPAIVLWRRKLDRFVKGRYLGVSESVQPLQQSWFIGIVKRNSNLCQARGNPGSHVLTHCHMKCGCAPGLPSLTSSVSVDVYVH